MKISKRFLIPNGHRILKMVFQGAMPQNSFAGDVDMLADLKPEGQNNE
jgi:hypothetical protein